MRKGSPGLSARQCRGMTLFRRQRTALLQRLQIVMPVAYGRRMVQGRQCWQAIGSEAVARRASTPSSHGAGLARRHPAAWGSSRRRRFRLQLPRRTIRRSRPVMAQSRPVQGADSGAQAFSCNICAACLIQMLVCESNKLQAGGYCGYSIRSFPSTRFNANRCGFSATVPSSRQIQDGGYFVCSRHAIVMSFHAKFHVAFALPNPTRSVGI